MRVLRRGDEDAIGVREHRAKLSDGRRRRRAFDVVIGIEMGQLPQAVVNLNLGRNLRRRAQQREIRGLRAEAAADGDDFHLREAPGTAKSVCATLALPSTSICQYGRIDAAQTLLSVPGQRPPTSP